ncbi:MAG: GNAT family N-acetyltransferase [Thermosynechococcaceae cyanobacterium]
MEQTKICVEVIRYGSAQYDQAAQLRYALFYQEHGISYESIFDQDEHQQIHVAVINTNNDVMAYGRLAQNNPLEFQIYQMVVKPDFQGHGFGSAILNALIQLAVEKGASQIAD